MRFNCAFYSLFKSNLKSTSRNNLAYEKQNVSEFNKMLISSFSQKISNWISQAYWTFWKGFIYMFWIKNQLFSLQLHFTCTSNLYPKRNKCWERTAYLLRNLGKQSVFQVFYFKIPKYLQICDLQRVLSRLLYYKTCYKGLNLLSGSLKQIIPNFPK